MASGKMFQSVKQPLPVRRRGVRQGKAALPPPKKRFLQGWREVVTKAKEPVWRKFAFC